MEEIAKGLVIGVGAGVTTAAILGAWRWFIRVRDRREQIPYIRDLIASQREKILSATDLPPYKPGGGPVPADCLRFVFFANFRALYLLRYLRERPRLRIRKCLPCKKILTDVDRAMTDLTLRERGIMPLGIAQSLFEKLQGLRWLRLPNRNEGIVASAGDLTSAGGRHWLATLPAKSQAQKLPVSVRTETGAHSRGGHFDDDRRSGGESVLRREVLTDEPVRGGRGMWRRVPSRDLAAGREECVDRSQEPIELA